MTGLQVVLDSGPQRARCGDMSPSGRMTCDYPPDHRVGGQIADHHYGRDRLGRWRPWTAKEHIA